MLSPHSFQRHERGWLLAIGQRLRIEYDAVAEPIPPRLMALLEQLGIVSGETANGRD